MKKEDITKFGLGVKEAAMSSATAAVKSKTAQQVVGASLLGAGIAVILPIGLMPAMGLGASYGAYKAFTTGAMAEDISGEEEEQ